MLRSLEQASGTPIVGSLAGFWLVCFDFWVVWLVFGWFALIFGWFGWVLAGLL